MLAAGDVVQDGSGLGGVHQGTHGRVGVEGVGGLVLRRFGQNEFHELIGPAFMNQHPRGCIAAFALVVEDAAGSRAGQVLGFREDDKG